MNSSILYIILCLYFEFIRADEYFKIKLQKGGKWSDNEIAEYLGHIPAFSEFTACHWEKLKYFATRSNTIWSYCKVYSVKDETLRCLQLYSYGLKSKAYRSLSYNIWITGMQNNETITVEIELPSYRHRTWNHVCWYFSSETGINELYFNGDLVQRVNSSNFPSIEGSLGSHDHHFIIGQEPDKIRGGFDEEQAFFGSISGLNIWNTSLSSRMIKDMSSCRNKEVGNVVSWQKKDFPSQTLK